MSAAKTRLVAQQSEAERHRHLQELREQIARDWDTLEFPQLQLGLRELVDRIEVDADDLKVYLRL
jgi:site-specific DNA recombinase